MQKSALIVLSALILAGCQSQSNLDKTVPPSEPATLQGDSTLEGKITQSGDKYYLIDSTGKQTEIDSYKIDFAEYVDKQVSITGQFSGDTLFGAEILVK